MPTLVLSDLSLVGAFLFLTVPLLIVIYLGFLLFIRPSKKVLLTSWLGGVVLAIVNLLVDIAAYYAHWWHYTLTELILHVPLPFYLSPFLIFGSLAYLLIWRFWHGRWRWLALTLLIGVPLFCVARDLLFGLSHTAYREWDNALLASLATIVMWPLGFYGGFLLFWRVAKDIEPQPQSGEEETSEQAHRAG